MNCKKLLVVVVFDEKSLSVFSVYRIEEALLERCSEETMGIF
jgi:hypothetical protein